MLIKYSLLNTRKGEISIWTDTGKMCAFGFASQGQKPESLPYSTSEKAKSAARKLIKSLPDIVLADIKS